MLIVLIILAGKPPIITFSGNLPVATAPVATIELLLLKKYFDFWLGYFYSLPFLKSEKVNLEKSS